MSFETGVEIPTAVQATLAKPAKAPVRRRPRVRSAAATLQAQGEPLVWLAGGSLAVALAMIVGFLVFILIQGLSTFWPSSVVEVRTKLGPKYLGEVVKSEWHRPEVQLLEELTPELKSAALAEQQANAGQTLRRSVRTGNYELTGGTFTWINQYAVAAEQTPEWAVVLERLSRGTAKGRFYGTPAAFTVQAKNADGTLGEVQRVADNSADAWAKFNEYAGEVAVRRDRAISLAKHDIGALSRRQQQFDIAAAQARLSYGGDSAEHQAALTQKKEYDEQAKQDKERIEQEIHDLQQENERYQLVMQPATGEPVSIPLATIVRGYPANQLGFWGKLQVYAARWAEFIFEEPREANTEGGVWPAIWGTVAMTVILSLLVVPFGVLAALYLREYAKSGPVVNAIRIAINNLAGVPSIVFGVFGLGFFCYRVGQFIDTGLENPADRWTYGEWWLGMLGLLATAAVASTCVFRGWKRGAAGHTLAAGRYGRVAFALWLVALVVVIVLLMHAPFYEGFYRAQKEVTKSPVFGTGGLLWASLTLALLTLPVVIVATEEALAAVPNSMREGSYACGASKWQTIWRIVLPRAMPGIMTGMILAMARGAGEVAPLILVGVKDSAQELPVDTVFPFVHLDRGFLHLSYQINMVGLKSPDAEAAKPMVFTMILLLITVIAALNIAAVWLRGRLRRKFVSAQF